MLSMTVLLCGLPDVFVNEMLAVFRSDLSDFLRIAFVRLDPANTFVYTSVTFDFHNLPP